MVNFLFINNYKGEKNDGPSKDVSEFKYCSATLTDIGHGTLRPPDDGSYSVDWGHNILEQSNDTEKMSFEQYCVINSCTHDGLQQIAKHNDYEQEWNDTKRDISESTSMADIRFLSLKLYAKHRNRRKYHLDPMEGGHRRAAMFQTNFGAELNPEDGSISGCLTYVPEDFRTATVTPDARVTARDIMGAYNSIVDQCSRDEGFLFDKCTVQVKYLSDKVVPVRRFLEACQICSEGIGREKRNSASKDVFVVLAKSVECFLNKTSDNGLMHRPWLGEFEYPGLNKFPATITTAEKSTKALDWKTDRDEISASLPLTGFHYTDIFEKYCTAPFNEDNVANFMAALEVPGVLNEKQNDQVSFGPPFLISYRSMAIDAGLGEKQRATTEMVNKWCMLPLCIHILWADKNNVSVVETAKDPRVAKLVIYAMRHHVHNHGFSNIGGHACMSVYDLQFNQCLWKGDTQIILAALYLTEIINATLASIDDEYENLSATEQGESTLPSREMLISLRREKLVEETKEVSLLLSTMNIYANCPGTDKMISELGKKFAFCKYYFHGSHNKTYKYSFFTSFLVHCRRRISQQSEEANKIRQKRSCTSRSTRLRSLDERNPGLSGSH